MTERREADDEDDNRQHVRIAHDRSSKRKEREMNRMSFRNKIVAAIAATSMVIAGFAAPAAAFAISTDTYVSAAATRAAGPAPEILGLSGVEESGQFVDVTDWPTSLLRDALGEYQWSQPKYVLAATSYNSSPNPYFANLFNSSGDLTAVYNAARAGGGAGPNASLAAYTADATDQAVWNLMPDVIIGTGGGTDNYDAAASAAATANGVDPDDYDPSVVTYSFSLNAGLIQTMYNIAGAADTEAADTGKTLRYGNATAIATAYEQYIKGTQGYILQQLAADKASKKTVALVTNAVENTESGGYTYTILGNDGGSDGTASTNRYLETCGNVANNLAGATTTTETTTSVLAGSDVDLILVGGQSSSSNYSTIMAALQSDGLLSKTYYVENNGSQGAMYGVVMNSVENAQNIGRILGCLYPEYIDQDDYIAYYYDNFYHIISDDATNSTPSSLATVMANALNGVRNYDGVADSSGYQMIWDIADASTYNATGVQNDINAGVAYIQSLGSNAPHTLLPSPDDL